MIRKAIPAIALLAMTVLPASAQAANVEINAQGPVVELNVRETIELEPDIATISAGVTSEARSAVEAMRQNAAEMRRVIDQIKGMGVDERDIQTTGINLNARYEYNRGTQERIFIGYQVSNRVSVKLRDIDQTGEVLDALVVAGATDLNGPNFSTDDDSAAKEEARKRAMERVRARALSYAQLAGYNDIKLLAISENLVGARPVPRLAQAADSRVLRSEAAPVQPGLVSAGVSISVKYEMINR